MFAWIPDCKFQIKKNSPQSGISNLKSRIELCPCKRRFQILLHCCSRLDSELFHQHLQHGRRYKRRQGPAVCFLCPGKAGSAECAGFLLVPREHQRERQVVDSALKAWPERLRSVWRSRRRCIARSPAGAECPNVAKIQLVEPILAAGERKDDTVFWQRFGKFGVIVAARLRPVASADQEEVLDLRRP